MGKKILDSKILYVVLSILISLSLWLWVTSKDENRERRGFSNLPITFEGVDILEDRNLMIVNQNVTASISIRANPRILATLKDTPPKLVASVSNINLEGTHSVNYTVTLPGGVSSSDVEIDYGLGGSAVSVEVARFLRREGIEIRGEFQGSAAEGYLAGDNDDFRFSPGTLTISGRADLVNQVAYAKVIVTGDNQTEAVSGEFPFQLIGASGDPLELDVTCDVDMIYATLPIRATAEIPLEVKLIDGGGLSGEKDVRLELSAESIVVAGSREAVDGLMSEGEIILTTIDLATLDDDMVENGGELTIPIPLDDQLENLSGIAEVKVSVKVSKRNVETREFNATRISYINAPEGWEPGIVTRELRVKVRGSKALLDELSEENIRVVADLKDVKESPGQYTVSANVYLDRVESVTDVGVVNPNAYTIVVSITREG